MGGSTAPLCTAGGAKARRSITTTGFRNGVRCTATLQLAQSELKARHSTDTGRGRSSYMASKSHAQTEMMATARDARGKMASYGCRSGALRNGDDGCGHDADTNKELGQELPPLGICRRRLGEPLALHRLLKEDGAEDGGEHRRHGEGIAVRVQPRQLVEQHGQDLVGDPKDHEGGGRDDLAHVQLEEGDGQAAPTREQDRRPNKNWPQLKGAGDRGQVVCMAQLEHEGEEQPGHDCASVIVQHEAPRRQTRRRHELLDQHPVQRHEGKVQQHPGSGPQQEALVRHAEPHGAQKDNGQARPRAGRWVGLVQHQRFQDGARNRHH
mmetsp:Transcript_20033/g.56827  ORF Transcript_20033/g.56827 Transcript_20033/m.56827 type:complete len:324 (-) Transcript_20033:556-1527(-)